MKTKRSQKGRKYFRKCGYCDSRHEQSEMYRDIQSKNGWCCEDCWDIHHMHEIISSEVFEFDSPLG